MLTCATLHQILSDPQEDWLVLYLFVCLFPQNEDSSTHEKLDFKLHFTCTSYLITTPCYRLVSLEFQSPQRFSLGQQSPALLTNRIHANLCVFPVMLLQSCSSLETWRAVPSDWRESICPSTMSWPWSASTTISPVHKGTFELLTLKGSYESWKLLFWISVMLNGNCFI